MNKFLSRFQQKPLSAPMGTPQGSVGSSRRFMQMPMRAPIGVASRYRQMPGRVPMQGVGPYQQLPLHAQGGLNHVPDPFNPQPPGGVPGPMPAPGPGPIPLINPYPSTRKIPGPMGTPVPAGRPPISTDLPDPSAATTSSGVSNDAAVNPNAGQLINGKPQAQQAWDNWASNAGSPQAPGATDTVPAMLTPGEAVLNRPAAQLAGRDNIQQLNDQGNWLDNLRAQIKQRQGQGFGGGQGFRRGSANVQSFSRAARA